MNKNYSTLLGFAALFSAYWL